MSSASKSAGSATGRGAVMQSRIRKKVAVSEKVVDMLITVKRVDGKTFQLKNGAWIEQGVHPGFIDVKLRFLSDDYFKLLEKHPDLKSILALGENLIFSYRDKTYQVSNS